MKTEFHKRRGRSRKSAYDRVKIQNLSPKQSHTSETVSESEESELFHFLPIPLMTLSLTIREKADCRSRKQKRNNNEPITMLVLMPSECFPSACDSHNLVFTSSGSDIPVYQKKDFLILPKLQGCRKEEDMLQIKDK